MKQPLDFAGNMVALVTPFRNGAIDRKALQTLVEHVIGGGVSALVPCGTTGESPTLSHDEHDEVVALVVEYGRGRVPVIAGAGSNSTAEAIRLSKAAARNGAHGLLSVTPYYNRPSQTGLIQHFLAIADATELPVVLYNIPSRTGVELSLDTIARLGEHARIQAIKEATGNVENVTRIRNASRLRVLSGDDSLTLPMLALGATGVVSVLSNLLPGVMTRLVKAALDGDLATAREEHDRHFELMKALFVETNPVPIKHALSKLGWILPELRGPLCPLAFGNQERLERVLRPFLEQLQ
jgi:4-hydroxy-tetrahydrodipicolinate synthase